MNNRDKKINSMIKIKKVSKKDLKLFLKWWKDEDLIRLTSGIKLKSNRILTSFFYNLLSSTKNHHFIILLNRRAIGHVALIHKNKNVFEINIIIGEKEYWGKGYGTASIKKAISYAFQKLNYQRAYLEVRSDNKRAIAAYTKCGFIKAGFKRYPNNRFQPRVLKMRCENAKI